MSRRSAAGPSAIPPLLHDLAAGRAPAASSMVDQELLRLASEHRMSGLLWTWARDNLEDSPARSLLALRDLSMQAHLTEVESVLGSCVSELQAVGIDVAAIKGSTVESRWYRRRGERPCSDVDLWLAPHQLDRATELVSLLQPEHPWVTSLDQLAVSGRVQSVTMRVDGLEVDLHLDLLKLGIPTRQAATLWNRTIMCDLPIAGRVRVLDTTSAVLHLLVHMNKDRFQRLLGFADIARIMSAGEVDWRLLQQLADGEGLGSAVSCSLGTVVDELGLDWPAELQRPRGLRARVWAVIWRPGIRLRGREGRLRFRRRQNWIAILAKDRGTEATLWWLREMWPPSATVEARYADVRGPYIWKLLRGRTRAIVEQRRELVRIRTNQHG